MYTRIQIPQGTPPEVQSVVEATIDPRLADVHAMFRLPLDNDGLSAACNFAIADVLFGVLEGVSAVLSPRQGGSGDAFRTCLSMYYHPEAEKARMPAVDPADLPDLLAARYRNPMQHALGLALGAPDTQGTRWPDPHGDTLFVFRDKERLDEAQIMVLIAQIVVSDTTRVDPSPKPSPTQAGVTK